ncbi:DUF2478 domain-containing protein [Marivita sp. S2033]|uniref:DUF2478 domain-containing protein n=1 Tax=Marivita sp. S2033 TaxID=3373187 RepID=UPI003981E98D
MKIASVTSSERGGTDQVLCDVAARLQSRGVSLAGVLKDTGYVSGFSNGCDMRVRVLPDGPVIKITQDLGSGSDACRLDPGAIAQAVASVEAGDLNSAELFILNKFGPEEAAGRGFCDAIGAALERGIPVLVGVSGASKAAFDAYADGLATALEPRTDAILTWFDVPEGSDQNH